MPASRGSILATPGLHWAPFAPNFDPILVHASFTGTSLGPFELHSCPRGMSRGKQSQQHWARGQSQHEFAVSCCRDFAEISAERKHCCHMARIFAVPIVGTPKPGKQAFCCAMFCCHSAVLGICSHSGCHHFSLFNPMQICTIPVRALRASFECFDTP